MRLKAALICLALSLSAANCARPAGEKLEPGAVATGLASRPLTSGVGEPVRVSPEGADAAEPAVAAAPDGTAYVAWVEHRRKREADVWLARVDAEGKVSGPPARVNPEAGGAAAWHGDPPSIAVARDGAVYVVWTARAAGSMHANTLHVSASRDGGRTFGPPSRVNDDRKSGPHGMHSLAVGPDGRVYVAWLDERNVAPPRGDGKAGGKGGHMESNREVFFASSSDGGRTFSPNRRVAGEVCPCCKTALAVAADGRVYLSWRQVLPGDFRHIAVASTSDGGRSFSAPVVVSDDRWMISGCPVSGAALAAGADGALRVLWYTAGEAGAPGLYWSESRDGGRTFSPRKAFAESGGRGTPFLLADGRDGFVAVWEGSGVEGRPVTARLSGDGRAGAGTALAEAGELPAAAKGSGAAFIAYVRKKEGARGVWLVREITPSRS